MKSRVVLKALLPALAGAVFVGLWYAIHFLLSEDNRFLLPTPGAILEALVENRAVLIRAAINTTWGALLGFGFAIVISALAALTPRDATCAFIPNARARASTSRPTAPSPAMPMWRP